MKLIQFAEPGPPDVLRVVEAPMPRAGAGEIVVQAKAIGVGIPDVLIRSGSYSWMPPLPATPGTEMTGPVVEIGAGVTGLTLGQNVYVSARERVHRGGCYAEFIAVKPSEVYALPDGVGLDAAATLANYQVAWHLLWSAARARKGETVLIYAAAGGVGSAAVELAKVAGLVPIGIVSSTAKGAFARSMGAAHVIDRSCEDILVRARELTNGRGADIVLDCVGGPKFIDSLQMLAPLGTTVIYGHLGGKMQGDYASALRAKFGDSPAVRAFSMHSFDHDPPRRAEATHALLAQLAKGEIKPAIHAKLPLAEAARAHRMLEAGEVLGKLLLVP